jgi:hypothetical protein
VRAGASPTDLGINAMYMDNDVAMTEDFYRVMKAPPMARHNLILQMEVQNIHGLNIGVIYCQNCAPGGRGAWVLHETVRLSELSVCVELKLP